MRRPALVCLLILCLIGCADRERMKLLGFWKGGFKTTSIKRGIDPKKAPDANLGGYLQLYVTHDKFKLHLENRNQTVDLEGTWKLTKDRVTLTVAKTVLGGLSKLDLDINKAVVIPADQIRDAFGKQIIVKVESGGTKLVGLDLEFGPAIGRLEFERAN